MGLKNLIKIALKMCFGLQIYLTKRAVKRLHLLLIESELESINPDYILPSDVYSLWPPLICLTKYSIFHELVVKNTLLHHRGENLYAKLSCVFFLKGIHWYRPKHNLYVNWAIDQSSSGVYILVCRFFFDFVFKFCFFLRMINSWLFSNVMFANLLTP